MTKGKCCRLGCGIALLSAIAGTLPCSAQKTPREVHVLAAADLQPVLPSLAEAFQHATGIKLVVSYGSSATLATQIINGDPADLFLAADFSYPEKVVAAGLADSGMPVAYARGTLVLWARKDSAMQPLTQNTLVEQKYTSLAIANPEHAPYGRAAVEALNRFKIYAAVQPRLVIAENIAHAAQFVESGNAQLGIISLTAASTEKLQQEGSYILLPPSTYFPLRQCAVVMKKSEHRADAHAFLDWLRSAPIQKNLQQYGLEPAD
ncbi:MAG TPA: molybdate ABC transporter substrate-binding protein [Acidobacteriaceae bacterium]|nr:molybdate ABC transporter substrate-binding protein [Acidobacteriaceae bacterium]